MTVLLARADARALPLRDGSVQTCVTSPPFWGLRSYQTGSAKHLELGSERTPEEYVEHMVKVFREVRRALRDDGTLWLEIGDTWAANRGYQVPDNKHTDVGNNGAMSVPPGMKAKDLVGVPWLLAFALRSDGWYLRQECIWHRGNPMPESVTDRPTRAHSTVFLFSKSASYYYDAEAVKEKSSGTAHARGNGVHAKSAEAGSGIKQNDSFSAAVKDVLPNRNLRSVWQINTVPFTGAHYATFPPRLVEPCILAGTSAKGACTVCGAPWERVVEREDISSNPVVTEARKELHGPTYSRHRTSVPGGQSLVGAVSRTTGWKPTCACGTEVTRPCVVLDPFAGTCVTARVAVSLRRSAVCFDLSQTYLSEMGKQRTSQVQVELAL